MADKGDPVLTIGGLTFSQDPTDDGCLQSSNYADTADELTYLCGNRNIKLPGSYTAGMPFSVALAKDDLATIQMLKSEGILTDFSYSPFGLTAGNIQHTSDSASVFGFTEGEAVNNIILCDGVIAVNNPVDAVIGA